MQSLSLTIKQYIVLMGVFSLGSGCIYTRVLFMACGMRYSLYCTCRMFVWCVIECGCAGDHRVDAWYVPWYDHRCMIRSSIDWLCSSILTVLRHACHKVGHDLPRPLPNPATSDVTLIRIWLGDNHCFVESKDRPKSLDPPTVSAPSRLWGETVGLVWFSTALCDSSL